MGRCRGVPSAAAAAATAAAACCLRSAADILGALAPSPSPPPLSMVLPPRTALAGFAFACLATAAVGFVVDAGMLSITVGISVATTSPPKPLSSVPTVVSERSDSVSAGGATERARGFRSSSGISCRTPI